MENAILNVALIEKQLVVGAVSVWCGGGISLAKQGLSLLKMILNTVTYRDNILQPAEIPYIHNCGGPNPILKDDNACPHKTRVDTDCLHNVEVKRTE